MKAKPGKQQKRKPVQETAVPVEPGGKYGKKHSQASKRMKAKATVKQSPSTKSSTSSKSRPTNAQATKTASPSQNTKKQPTKATATKTATKAQSTSQARPTKRTKANQARTKGKRPKDTTRNTQGNTIGHRGKKTVGIGGGARSSARSSAVPAEEPINMEVPNEFSDGTTGPIDQLSARFSRTLGRVFRKGRALRSDARPPTVKLIKAICAVIRQGNHVETAVRAFGIRNNVYRQWIERGFTDISAGDSTPYALFVAACDAADAQAEALDIMAIRQGIENWQALAWLRERKSFARWGLKSVQLTAGAGEPLVAKLDHSKALEPELAANVLAALEEAGIVTIPGQEHESGIPEEIIIEGRAQEAAIVEQGEAVVAEMRD